MNGGMNVSLCALLTTMHQVAPTLQQATLHAAPGKVLRRFLRLLVLR